MLFDENKLLRDCRMISKRHWLFYHLNDLIILLLIIMYVTLMITILYNIKNLLAPALNLILVGLELAFLNPEKLSNLKNSMIWVRLILVLISLQLLAFLVQKLAIFCCYLIIQVCIYFLFKLSSFSNKNRNSVFQDLQETFKLKKDEGSQKKSIIKAIDVLLENRTNYRNSIFKALWALLSIVIFPSIIGLMSIYSNEIREWLVNGWILVVFGLIFTFLFFYVLLTPTLFELVNTLQYVLVPERRILVQTMDLLKS